MGVGLGGYQEAVVEHYDGLPKLNTLEPSTQSGFLVLAVSTGVLGLSVFFWILLHLFSLLHSPASRSALEMDERENGDFEQGIAGGLWGALTAFVGVNIFYDASSSYAIAALFTAIAVMISLQHEGRDEEVQHS